MSAPLRLVLAGGGHSHVEVLRQFAMHRPANVMLTLITRDALAAYSGMLPGFIAGHYAYEECHIDVRDLARMAGARICLSEVEGLDFDGMRVSCTGRPAIPFDVLSLNIGSRPAMDGVAGAREWAWPAKPVDAFIRRWQTLLAELSARPRAYRIVVVGGGAGGVELTLTMQHALRGVAPGTSFTIISASEEVLPTHNSGVRRRFERVLRERGVATISGDPAADVTEGELSCVSGARIPFDTLVWATQAAPPQWLRSTGLAVDGDGFALVNDALQSVSHEFVFAAGDVASLASGARAKSGVFAVREGPTLARNLRNAAMGRPLEAYRAQRRHLALISTGGRAAIASRGRWSAGGAWVWRWKDRIDRRWMDRYRFVVPSMSGMAAASGMPGHTADEPAMPCAGCGAKLGHATLEGALTRLKTARRPDVLIGLDAPDDAAVVEPPPGKLAVHTVDFFPPLVDDAFLAGKIAAVHCLSDVYAMGAVPHTALAMVTLPYSEPARSEDELTELLAGALSVLMPDHTALVGGHTLQGDVMLFGLSVNGLLDRERALARNRPRPGDELILTKPLGIGAIFAADMRGLAQNDWLSDAIASMTQSNALAARILFEHGATMCTDVTGFGLAGHLVRVLRQTGLAADLDILQIPVIPGAHAATGMGIRSSLYPANAAAKQDIAIRGSAAESPVYSLLFDPQTAGGFVAAVPPDRADACVAALHSADYRGAAKIGTLREAAPGDLLLRL